MKKERILSFDFIRMSAVFLILLTHYNARYLVFYMNPPMPQNVVFTSTLFHTYTGNVGVSLFFILSGASLMYVYSERCDLASFYRKRFIAIYPMFWAAYGLAYMYYFFVNKSVPYTVHQLKWNWLLTLIGMDGYLNSAVPTGYLLGEWFLGIIIIMYLIFPVLRKILLRAPVLSWIIILLLYIPFAFCERFPNFAASKLLLVRLPEFYFGMCFMKWIRKSNVIIMVCGAGFLAAITAVNPPVADSFRTTYIGISLFLILSYIGDKASHPAITGFCKWISKYSYAVFLCHHIVIDQICNSFPMETLVWENRYFLF